MDNESGRQVIEDRREKKEGKQDDSFSYFLSRLHLLALRVDLITER
jgi:hypothetical protein